MQDQNTREMPRAETHRRRRWYLIPALIVGGLVGMFLLAQLAANLVAGDPWNVEPGQAVVITVTPGTPASAIYQSLHDAGVVRASQIRETARNAGVEDQLQAGTYAFVTDMDPDDVMRQLLLGGDDIDGATFTIVEGWTISRILDELAIQTDFTRADFESVLTSDGLSSPYLPDVTDEITSLTRWEGLLYPATYPVGGDSTAQTILSQMTTEMAIRTTDIVDWPRIDDLGITRYEALIIASLIEREAGTDEDRPLISSVIHNRLEEGIRLQIDATVVYALGGVNGRVTGEDLKTESPYNTYRVDGLPPTPIGTVRDLSLTAALRPATTDFLFYVLADEDGSHAFARTYEEHQKNIAEAKKSGVLP